MFKQNLISLIVLIFTAVLISGCSGGSNSIVTPGMESNQDSALSGLPVGVSDWDSDMAPIGGIGALGIFNLRIEPSDLSAEFTSLRSSSLMDVLEAVDITNFLSMAPCYDCAKIDSISLDADGHLVVSIGIKHPFGAGDPFKPISGKNRADLHVFNVEGTIVSNAGGTTFPNLNVTASDFTLVNADGYSGYLNDVLDEFYPTDATIHPYILHFDDYTIGNFDSSNPMGFQSVTDPPPSGNLVMAMGCDYDYQDYVFDFGSEPVDFIYAIGCTYAVSSASKNERFTPEFRIPQHNKKAASEVSVLEISNDLAAGNPTSSAEIEIHVVDISHGIATGADLNQMFADSSVSAISIGLPGVESAIVNVDISSPTGTGQDPTDPLVFPATITNSASAGDGTYVGLVKVIDSYATGLNESPLLGGMDGIKRVEPIQNPLVGLFPIAEFATYITFEIEISGVPEDPIAIILTTPDPADVSSAYPIVTFDGSTSYDPDGGPITLYEWDFDWDLDPANFVPDISGTDAVVDYNYHCPEATYYTGLRVTDDDTPAGVSAIESVIVNITEGFTPGTWDGTIDLGYEESIQGDHYVTVCQALQTDSTGTVHVITSNPDYAAGSDIFYRTWNGTSLTLVDTFHTSNNIAGVNSVLDNSDNLHVIWWEGNPKQLKHTIVTPAGFTNPVETLHTSVSGYNDQWMNTRKNDAGDIMITWITYDSGSWLDSKFMHTINTGSGFSTPIKHTEQINIRLTTDGTSNHHVGPVLVATPDNKFHEIFYMLENDIAIEPSNRVIYEMVYDGTSWGSFQVVYDNPSSIYCPYDFDAISTPDGDIHLVGPQLAGSYIEYYLFDSETSTWQTPINLTMGFSGFPYATLEIDDSGYIHLFWTMQDGANTLKHDLYMKVFCRWSSEADILGTPSTLVDDTNLRKSWTDLEWDADGNLLAIYQDDWFNEFYTKLNRLVY